MHAQDGLLDLPTSIGAGGVAAAGLALCLRGARRELNDRTAPLAGLVATYVFAAQMINFPVGAGTSGHLLGGALAAVLVGPCTGALVVTVVLIVQAFTFADGGLSALGLNVATMALATVAVGYPLTVLLLRALSRASARPWAVLPVAAGIAAGVSVVASSLAFVVFYAIGGTTEVPLGQVTLAMVGVHALIGIGEGLITAVTVAAIAGVRPDLVYAARHLARPATGAPITVEA